MEALDQLLDEVMLDGKCVVLGCLRTCGGHRVTNNQSC